MGAGKSTIANLLRHKLKRTAILKIEDVRELISDFKHNSEDHALAWKIIYRMCDEYFKNGISVQLEQTVASKEIVNKFLSLAKRHKCSIGFYHVRAPKNILLDRIHSRSKDRKATKALIMSNIKKHEAMIYPGATVLDTSKVSSNEAVKIILTRVKV